MTPSFTEQWYPPDDERALRAFAAAVNDTPGAVIELGSYEGRSALILRDQFPDRRVLCVDAWPDAAVYARFLANTEGMQIEHARMTWDEFKHETITRDVAVVHIDMDHTYHQVCEQIRWAMSVLPTGGIMVGHDYEPGWPEVMQAVDDLLPHRKVVVAHVWAAQR